MSLCCEARDGFEQCLDMDVLMLRGQGWQRAVLGHGCPYAARPGMVSSSAWTWMSLCGEARDGNEQYLDMDVLMLRGQGWLRAVFGHGCPYAVRPGMVSSSAWTWMSLCCEARDGNEQYLDMDVLMLRGQGGQRAVLGHNFSRNIHRFNPAILEFSR